MAEHSADCVPLCGATKAYGKNARWWHHEPACLARIRPSEDDEGLPDCEGWTCQSCGADNFIPDGFARVTASGKDSQ